MSSNNLQTQKRLLPGPAGQIELLIDTPDGPIAGLAIVTHPHPKLGGTAEHKIPQIMARAFQSHGFLAVRPNFRGVGATEGAHDGGSGETDDIIAVVRRLREEYPGLPVVLAGFSFGAYVQAMAAKRLREEGRPIAQIVLAGVPYGTVAGHRSYDTPPVPENALIIHGEADSSVPLSNVFEWARPQRLPVVVFPGANHFFTGYLHSLKTEIVRHLACPQVASG